MRKWIFAALLLAVAFIPSLARESQESVVLGANSAAQGMSTSFSNVGTCTYLKITLVDPTVNRLRIVDAKNRVLYDARPQNQDVIYMPPAVYQATVWSGYGSSPALAIKGVFTSEPPREKPAPKVSPKPMASPVQTPYAAPGYNPYNYYYPHRLPPIQPTPKATSVTDPNYLKQQKAVTDPAYQQKQTKVTDPQNQKSKKKANDTK
jgi:hypothetical protein